MPEPSTRDVMAWLGARPDRSIHDAITTWWGAQLDRPTYERVHARLRRARCDARKADPPATPTPTPAATADAVLAPAAELPARRGDLRPVPPAPEPTDDPRVFAERALSHLLLDLSEARRRGFLNLVRGLDERISAWSAELRKLRPEPEAPAVQPIFSDLQLAAMTGEQLEAAIRGLGALVGVEEDPAPARSPRRAVQARPPEHDRDDDW